MSITIESLNKIKDVAKREELKEKIKLGYRMQQAEERRGDFLKFVKHMWPGFINGYHHEVISEKFNRLASGECKRLLLICHLGILNQICIVLFTCMDDWTKS